MFQLNNQKKRIYFVASSLLTAKRFLKVLKTSFDLQMLLLVRKRLAQAPSHPGRWHRSQLTGQLGFYQIETKQFLLSNTNND